VQLVGRLFDVSAKEDTLCSDCNTLTAFALIACLERKLSSLTAQPAKTHGSVLRSSRHCADGRGVSTGINRRL